MATDLLALQVECVLAPLVGSKIAKLAVRRQCQELELAGSGLSHGDLDKLAERIGTILQGQLGPSAAAEVVQRVRSLDQDELFEGLRQPLRDVDEVMGDMVFAKTIRDLGNPRWMNTDRRRNFIKTLVDNAVYDPELRRQVARRLTAVMAEHGLDTKERVN